MAFGQGREKVGEQRVEVTIREVDWGFEDLDFLVFGPNFGEHEQFPCNNICNFASDQTTESPIRSKLKDYLKKLQLGSAQMFSSS